MDEEEGQTRRPHYLAELDVDKRIARRQRVLKKEAVLPLWKAGDMSVTVEASTAGPDVGGVYEQRDGLNGSHRIMRARLGWPENGSHYPHVGADLSWDSFASMEAAADWMS